MPGCRATLHPAGSAASTGRSRKGTDAVIVELGANGRFARHRPEGEPRPRSTVLSKLHDRHVFVLLAGMQAPRNIGADYVRSFDAIYPALASAAIGSSFYPFFLDGVAADPKLNQSRRPAAERRGVDAIVERMLPQVEELVARVRGARGM